jgi:hypothetical protein
MCNHHPRLSDMKEDYDWADIILFTTISVLCLYAEGLSHGEDYPPASPLPSTVRYDSLS